MDSFEPIIYEGCNKNDVGTVKRGIEGMGLNGNRGNSKILRQSLNSAVLLQSYDVVRYLLDEEKVPINSVKPGVVHSEDPREMVLFLLDRGWDINQSDPPRKYDPGPGRRLLQYIFSDETLMRWLLDHGASAKDPHPDPYISPPILDNVASAGTIRMFEHLRSRGAEIGIRTLHCAVEHACRVSPESRAERMDMVRHLVITRELDVNAIDSEQPEFNHYGRPLCYAIFAHGGVDSTAEVVRFLIDHGADPFKINDWYGWNAISQAKKQHPAIFDVIKDYISYEEDERCQILGFPRPKMFGYYTKGEQSKER